MRPRLTAIALLCTALGVTGATLGQESIYYKFESGGGERVINYATDDPTAPREGTINTSAPLAAAWAGGRFGRALAAGQPTAANGYEVNTGWKYLVRGDLTVAFFLRLAHPVTGFGTIFGDVSTGHWFGMDMGAQPGSFGWLTLHWHDGTYRNLRLRKDIHTLATGKWVHIAIVVRPGVGLAQWFIDGKPEVRQVISGFQPIVRSVHRMRVGRRDQGYWRLDEFRVSQRAASATEILAWSTSQPGAQTPFGTSCHPRGRLALLDGTVGGRPVVGNGGYALEVYGLPQSSVILAHGANNQALLGLTLPLDLGLFTPNLAGCQLRTSADFVRYGNIGPTGALRFALGIPNIASVRGVQVYSQAILQSTILQTHMLTNAHALVVGN